MVLESLVQALDTALILVGLTIVVFGTLSVFLHRLVFKLYLLQGLILTAAIAWGVSQIGLPQEVVIGVVGLGVLAAYVVAKVMAALHLIGASFWVFLGYGLTFLVQIFQNQAWVWAPLLLAPATIASAYWLTETGLPSRDSSVEAGTNGGEGRPVDSADTPAVGPDRKKSGSSRPLLAAFCPECLAWSAEGADECPACGAKPVHSSFVPCPDCDRYVEPELLRPHRESAHGLDPDAETISETFRTVAPSLPHRADADNAPPDQAAQKTSTPENAGDPGDASADEVDTHLSDLQGLRGRQNRARLELQEIGIETIHALANADARSVARLTSIPEERVDTFTERAQTALSERREIPNESRVNRRETAEANQEDDSIESQSTDDSAAGSEER